MSGNIERRTPNAERRTPNTEHRIVIGVTSRVAFLSRPDACDKDSDQLFYFSEAWDQARDLIPLLDPQRRSLPFEVRCLAFGVRRFSFHMRCFFPIHFTSFSTAPYPCEYAVNTSSMSGSTQRSPNNFKSGKGQFVRQL